MGELGDEGRGGGERIIMGKGRRYGEEKIGGEAEDNMEEEMIEGEEGETNGRRDKENMGKERIRGEMGEENGGGEYAEGEDKRGEGIWKRRARRRGNEHVVYSS